jgi:hypothetical protein
MSLSKKSVSYAKKFISLLPDNYPRPELAPEPEGELGLIWQTKDKYLALSIDDNGELAYAYVNPDARHRGIIEFCGEIPQEILQLISDMI